ncbi:hypothetical protein GCM10010885_22070 [Alicyclobacillus cellulosilyticus]|uniref:Polysaccharide deacetylase n=1 Tax=Alicyclobacillus cellulosilyticus TaxID=1003997 RepID=A0A917KJH9_9BACL|nr:hypothetical protein [Alicyclobacillus cellulosilyticus]GGJ12289.1 hypothetical protein GCM10010885_22070 [Alicyclobacillus cellulosilyticus]
MVQRGKAWLAALAAAVWTAGCSLLPGENGSSGPSGPAGTPPKVSAGRQAGQKPGHAAAGHGTSGGGAGRQTAGGTVFGPGSGAGAAGGSGMERGTGAVVPKPPAPAEHLVPYNGPVQHIFFHPLIAYPARAFDHPATDKQMIGMNDWMITVSEFDKILQALYQDHFILIDIHLLYQVKQQGGRTVVVPRQLMLPKGKKPLILSIDDMNYYEYMVQYGCVSRLVVDKQGRIGALSIGPGGKPVVRYDDEIVPILDGFVAKHPDFSFHGAKGMIDLTGYEGVLGYRTDEITAKNYPQVRAQATRLIQALKRDGWTFASHSYGHLNEEAISYAKFVNDTERWLREVEPLTGPTDVYVYPFGGHLPVGSDKFQFLVHAGFHVICSVGPTTYVQWTPQALLMDRRHIDGVALHEEPKDLADLFDASKVIDPARPDVY